jgi:hypothetical protein
MLICLFFVLTACNDAFIPSKTLPPTLTAVAGFAAADLDPDRPIADFETLADDVVEARDNEPSNDDLSLRGNPNFSESQLPAEARKWYRRLWAAIANPLTMEGDEGDERVNEIAGDGDLSRLGRVVNMYVTSLLTTFRVTGDLQLLDEVDRVMQLARGPLRDYNGDGYMSWRWLRDPSHPYYGTDEGSFDLDRQLTHGFVAHVAYAFHVNADLDPRYQERAAFWTDYLKNHFERRWRETNEVGSGFPFMVARMTHAYANWTRYHYYMHKLTAERGYLDEAERMAAVIGEQMVEVNGGSAFVWDHFVTQEPHNEGTQFAASFGCQPTTYARYTMHSMHDLANEGFSIFDRTFMRKIAGTLRDHVMNNGAESFAHNVCRGEVMAGLATLEGSDHDPGFYLGSTFTELAAWDPSGRIIRIAEEVYRDREAQFLENPRRVFIPAATVFVLSR